MIKLQLFFFQIFAKTNYRHGACHLNAVSCHFYVTTVQKWRSALSVSEPVAFLDCYTLKSNENKQCCHLDRSCIELLQKAITNYRFSKIINHIP